MSQFDKINDPKAENDVKTVSAAPSLSNQAKVKKRVPEATKPCREPRVLDEVKTHCPGNSDS